MPLDLKVFATVFGVIFLAELPDKTALAALLLATRYRAAPVLLGAALALMVQSIVAVAAGGLVSLLPARPVHIGAGVLLLVSAVVLWRRKSPDSPEMERRPSETKKANLRPRAGVDVQSDFCRRMGGPHTARYCRTGGTVPKPHYRLLCSDTRVVGCRRPGGPGWKPCSGADES